MKSIALFVALLVSGLAHASGPEFQRIPALGLDDGGLNLRIVRYTGGTNGGMEVEVRNPGRVAKKFNPKGIFFIPDMPADDAPQRLGAAGPMEVQLDDDWKALDDATIRPGETRRFRLQVFCIDSHRSSPSPSTPFRLAKKRLPKELRAEIEQGTRKIMRSQKAKTAKKSSSDVQGHVWKTRNKKWIKLEGERKNERAPKRRQRPRKTKRKRLMK